MKTLGIQEYNINPNGKKENEIKLDVFLMET